MSADHRDLEKPSLTHKKTGDRAMELVKMMQIEGYKP
jgi:hypothetical protein